MSNIGKEFSLYGNHLVYEEEVVRSNEIFLSLREIEKEIAQEFPDRFYEEFKNMDQAIRGIYDLSFDYINRGAKWIQQFLAEKGIYNYDYNRFMAVAAAEKTFDVIYQAIEYVEEKYIAIINDQRKAEEYRKMRKENREKWQERGKIDGLLSGTTAGTASGIAHSAMNTVGNAASAIGASDFVSLAVNAVGNATTALSAKMKKDELYKSPEVVDVYSKGIIAAIDALIYPLAKILKEESEFYIQTPKKEDVEEGNALTNNMQLGYIKDKDMILEKCLEVLRKHPYNQQAYEILRENFDDPNGELRGMSQYFGVSVIQEYIDKELQKIVEETDFYSLEGIDKGQTVLDEWAQHYGYAHEDFSHEYDAIRKLVGDNARLVDGYEYESVELADKVRRKLDAILTRINETSANDEAAMEEIMKALEESPIETKEKYLEYLRKERELANLRLNTVAGVVYDTREAADLARREYAKAADILKKEVFTSRGEIEDIIDELKTFATEEVRVPCLSFAEDMLLQCEKQEELSQREGEPSFASRTEFSEYFFGILEQKSVCGNVFIDSFALWYQKLQERYTVINGKQYGIEEADKAYYKLVEHAGLYEKNVLEVEEPREKKSFFASLKSGISNAIYKNYEGEYNFVTKGRTVPIPEFSKEEYNDLKQKLSITLAAIRRKQENFNKRRESLCVDISVVEYLLNVEKLYHRTIPVSASEVNKILRKDHPKLTVKENEVKEEVE